MASAADVITVHDEAVVRSPVVQLTPRVLAPWDQLMAERVAEALAPLTERMATDVARALEPITVKMSQQVAAAMEPLTQGLAQQVAAAVEPLTRGPGQRIADAIATPHAPRRTYRPQPRPAGAMTPNRHAAPVDSELVAIQAVLGEIHTGIRTLVSQGNVATAVGFVGLVIGLLAFFGYGASDVGDALNAFAEVIDRGTTVPLIP